MKHKTFLWFILPSALAMILFIALPIVSVLLQSVFAPHEQVMKEVENCDVFGCKTSVAVDVEATAAQSAAAPLGRFVGADIYADRNHLALSEISSIWSSSTGGRDFVDQILNLPFYGALAFTITYTALVTPFAILLGFAIALCVNAIPRLLRGPAIFFSLLPMIVTPLVGALILFWMVDARGILGAALQSLLGDPDLSVKASTPLMWAMLIVYGVWSTCPFAFVVYYAGLQTVPQDTLESAMIDGATRWQRLRFVIIPHLVPLTTFLVLIKIMDNFRVFEPIVSFSGGAHAQSLSYFIYADLNATNKLLSSAAATSVLTILGVIVLLAPVIVRTWKSMGRPAS
jgi:ABC-type sugar transport system permease subunit